MNREALEAIIGGVKVLTAQDGMILTPGTLAAAILAAFPDESDVEYEYRRVKPDGNPQLNAIFQDMPELDEGWSAERRTLGPWIEVSS